MFYDKITQIHITQGSEWAYIYCSNMLFSVLAIILKHRLKIDISVWNTQSFTSPIWLKLMSRITSAQQTNASLLDPYYIMLIILNAMLYLIVKLWVNKWISEFWVLSSEVMHVLIIIQ